MSKLQIVTGTIHIGDAVFNLKNFEEILDIWSHLTKHPMIVERSSTHLHTCVEANQTVIWTDKLGLVAACKIHYWPKDEAYFDNLLPCVEVGSVVKNITRPDLKGRSCASVVVKTAINMSQLYHPDLSIYAVVSSKNEKSLRMFTGMGARVKKIFSTPNYSLAEEHDIVYDKHLLDVTEC